MYGRLSVSVSLMSLGSTNVTNSKARDHFSEGRCNAVVIFLRGVLG